MQRSDESKRKQCFSKGHDYDYWTCSGTDSYYDLILKWVGVVYNSIKKIKEIWEWSSEPSSIIIRITDISMSHHFLPEILFVLLDCAVVQSWILQDHILPRVAILSGGRSHMIRLCLDCDSGRMTRQAWASILKQQARGSYTGGQMWLWVTWLFYGFRCWAHAYFRDGQRKPANLKVQIGYEDIKQISSVKGVVRIWAAF